MHHEGASAACAPTTCAVASAPRPCDKHVRATAAHASVSRQVPASVPEHIKHVVIRRTPMTNVTSRMLPTQRMKNTLFQHSSLLLIGQASQPYSKMPNTQTMKTSRRVRSGSCQHVSRSRSAPNALPAFSRRASMSPTQPPLHFSTGHRCTNSSTSVTKRSSSGPSMSLFDRRSFSIRDLSQCT